MHVQKKPEKTLGFQNLLVFMLSESSLAKCQRRAPKQKKNPESLGEVICFFTVILFAVSGI